ncbi:glycoside hydrolase family 18 protein [Amanita thiersii Skay4041]|uniref:Glycoside hydrolase family 18 protein n=1 Tax=Amanita thiersii Skay4041 TaxID=703135 RepID=A0A2A9NV23_9AGAR|nr:glycoside hydrolase family 18 protein [Amanita thiersii Skay4041]
MLSKVLLGLACCTWLQQIVACPVCPQSNESNPSASTLQPPYFLIYGDKFVSGQSGPPPASQLQGYNVYALSFLLTSGAADKAMEWQQLSDSQRTTIKQEYAAAGIKLIVALFGSTDTPTSSGSDPVATAQKMAAWVKKYNVDGVDVDYEDFNAFNAGDGKAEAWVANFTRALRAELPAGTYILTHAPVAPWFSPNKFGGGGYLKIDSTVGNMIDWYNIQFYNQGVNEYTTCDGLLNNSTSTWPGSALLQIGNSGVPLSKLVVGKPGTTADANNGYMPTSTLASCLQKAKEQTGWNAGAMVWQYPNAGSQWIKEVRSLAFP